MATEDHDTTKALHVRFGMYLRERASRYYPDLPDAAVSVELISMQDRSASTLYRFAMSTASSRRSILVKVPTVRGAAQKQRRGDDASPRRQRPRLASETETEIKSQLEYGALSEIYSYFHGLADPRFGAIRILDFLPEHRAIVMEEVQDPSLRQLFAKSNWRRFPLGSIDLETPFRNAGAWLRAYHALPSRRVVEARHTRRSDFLESVQNFADFLGHSLADVEYFDELAKATKERALALLPESLPLGLGHGDYAMRNILVGAGNRITAFDTLAKWRTPIYEDIAYFLIELKTIWPQILTQGSLLAPGVIRRYEAQFLQGYFEPQTIPIPTVRLYEIQAILDKWSDVVVSAPERAGQSVAGRARIALTHRFFRRIAAALLREVAYPSRASDEKRYEYA